MVVVVGVHGGHYPTPCPLLFGYHSIVSILTHVKCTSRHPDHPFPTDMKT